MVPVEKTFCIWPIESLGRHATISLGKSAKVLPFVTPVDYKCPVVEKTQKMARLVTVFTRIVGALRILVEGEMTKGW